MSHKRRKHIDKSKLSENWGRKASGLKSVDYDCQVTYNVLKINILNPFR